MTITLAPGASVACSYRNLKDGTPPAARPARPAPAGPARPSHDEADTRVLQVAPVRPPVTG